MMEFQLDRTVEVLTSTPAAVDALLRGKSDAWLNCRLAEGTFSPVDVLGHMIYGELTDWIPRARQILEGRGDTPFEPFDRRGHEPLIAGKPIGELLDWFADLRRENLKTLRGFELDDRKLAMPGTHPDPNLGRVTLRNLLATWAVHDLGHIAQITRVMAAEYRAPVGPWRAYLTIL
jgi:hypothetical protein